MPTITGYVEKANGAVFVGNLVFRPLSTPTVIGGKLVVTEDIQVVTDNTGAFSTTLRPGNYVVVAGYSKPKAFSVPNAAGPFVLDTLIPFLCGTPDGSGGFGPTVITTARTGIPGVAALRALTQHLNNQLEYLLWHTVEFDGGQGNVYFNAPSTEVDNNATVFRPNDIAVDSPGRWLRV